MSEYLLSSICSDLVFRGTNYSHISNAGVSLSLFEYLGLIAQYLEELFKLFLIIYFSSIIIRNIKPTLIISKISSKLLFL